LNSFAKMQLLVVVFCRWAVACYSLCSEKAVSSLTRVFEKAYRKPACGVGAGGPGKWLRRKKQVRATFLASLCGPTDGRMRPSGTCRNQHPTARVGLAVAGLPPAPVGPCPPDSRHSENLNHPASKKLEQEPGLTVIGWLWSRNVSIIFSPLPDLSLLARLSA
jgi:hypothetical protein